MTIAYQAKVWLIKAAKVLPFFLCALVLIAYVDSLRALIAEDYALRDDGAILNTPLSWCIGSVFEYGAYAIVVAVILAFALETCVWNKLAIVYLTFNLAEKSFFANHEFDNEVYYVVSIINIALCAFFVYKGIKQLKK